MDERRVSQTARGLRMGVDGKGADARRRDLLKTLVAAGIAVPATSVLGMAPMARRAAAAPAADAAAVPAALRPEARPRALVRDFADPVLELKRLLREAAEIEHALLLQYTYAALSLKPAYQSVAGYGAPGEEDLLGVAVEEMQHLGAVNRLMVAMGGSPLLSPLEFPFEPEIYPFAFNLEPMSRRSLARYVYCEAPIGFFDHATAGTPDGDFAASVIANLGPQKRPNHVGSLYATVIDLAQEIARAPDPDLTDMGPWIETMHKIKDQGEDGHFKLFRSLFLGTHPGFAAQPAVWNLAPSHPDYPVHAVPVNPTAYVGHEGELANPEAVALAWLGNLQYWTALALLDQHFRHDEPAYRELAVAHMMGPVLSLGRHLPTLGAGMPFDAFGLPYASGTDPKAGAKLVESLLREGERVAAAIEKSLPSDYPTSLNGETLAALDGIVTGQRHASR